MELMQELFFTASLAMILSFLVVKLVSRTTIIGDAILPRRCKENISVATNDIQITPLEQRMTAQTSQSETKVDANDSHIVCPVDGFHCQRQPPVKVDTPGEIEHRIDDMKEESIELHSQEVLVNNGFPQQSQVVELPEKSPEQSTHEDADNNDNIPLHEQEEQCGITNSALKQTRCEDHVVCSDEISVESSGENDIVNKSKDISGDQENESNYRVEDEMDCEEGGDDDWEGIERTELEKVFAAATKFVDGDSTGSTDERLSSLERDVQMEMYGLKKIATEGPCHEHQPMALKISARAKWNAWQKLGNMNPEAAMEQYISLLSNRVPDWTEETSTGKRLPESAKTEILSSVCPDSRSPVSYQLKDMDKRDLGHDPGSKQSDRVLVSELDNQAKEKE